MSILDKNIDYFIPPPSFGSNETTRLPSNGFPLHPTRNMETNIKNRNKTAEVFFTIFSPNNTKNCVEYRF